MKERRNKQTNKKERSIEIRKKEKKERKNE